ncbi:hydroxyacylglutathione hydrolase [Salipiger mucosus]|uniref:Hydroxyacylglutathione hydrolase n=1 Tax=Salipiger mucosus DSM 16094 TaxID=1123237 RepID=S9R4A1_9RHOB|nr:hydroxyacylglutathione hydrolase [Salipiger mucosus]EPX86752.1 Hydroxyacylglutathione hydrolase [Salipiger mucosus DSM 16094]
MPLEIVTVPCLSDNYAYLVKAPDGVILVDAPEAGPILAELESRGWELDTLLITHHHHDHVGGVAELREKYGCAVMGPRAEEAKLPPLTQALEEGDDPWVAGTEVRVISVPGHTMGHVAFYMPEGEAAFTADSLMALGCGRVFEGTPEMMWESLSKLAELPPETMIYSGHEYTQANARFAETIEPGNEALKSRIDEIAKARSEGRPTVPCALSEELATNPFLRPDSPEIRERLEMPDDAEARVFAEIRARKDRF